MVKVLMVEDDRAYAQEIAGEVLSLLEDVQTSFAQDVQTAIAAIEADPPDLVLVDMIFPLTPADLKVGRPSPEGGERVIAHVTRLFPWIRIVILSGQEKSKAISLLFGHRGITDYIFKDSPYDEIRVRILKQLEAIRCQKAQVGGAGPALVGESAPMQTLRTLIAKIAPEPLSVLILGETGTGKEVVAHQIHSLSRRRGGPFVKVNCAAFAESLLESELFGHRKGSFTGAESDRVGRFEAAEGGTLLLDEIGEVTESVQVKLLRFLQEREFEPVGSNRTVRVDVRLICATNRDLAQMVKEGKFRQDFYHRIRVMPLSIPTLADRKSDIPLLAAHFLKRLARERTRPVTRISPAATSRLMTYSWPGNVRELENVLARAAILADGDEIQEADLYLPEEEADEQPGQAGDPATPWEGFSTGATLDLSRDVLGRVSLRDLVAQFERQVLVRALERTHFDVQQAAQLLGVDKRTLHNKLNLHRISRRRKRFAPSTPD